MTCNCSVRADKPKCPDAQKRTREEAYKVTWEALNLAKDLMVLSELRDPSGMKLSARLSRKKLMKILKENHELSVSNTRSAYALLRLIEDWADEYPLIKGEKE